MNENNLENISNESPENVQEEPMATINLSLTVEAKKSLIIPLFMGDFEVLKTCVLVLDFNLFKNFFKNFI